MALPSSDVPICSVRSADDFTEGSTARQNTSWVKRRSEIAATRYRSAIRRPDARTSAPQHACAVVTCAARSVGAPHSAANVIDTMDCPIGRRRRFMYPAFMEKNVLRAGSKRASGYRIAQTPVELTTALTPFEAMKADALDAITVFVHQDDVV